MEPSILDIIAQSTAKTIEDVSKLYHETYAEGEPQPQAQPRAEPSAPEPDKGKPADRAADTEVPFFRYGTPFPDIIRFTKDVEVFTRHIDAQTRGSFDRGGEAKEPKKE